jgi:3-oxoacyl-[acyl-carrier-protein] synthase-3
LAGNTLQAAIISSGSFVPANRLAAEQLESELGLCSGWIESRTGVRQFAVASDMDAVSDLAIRAAALALERARFSDCPPIKTLILATSTPDHLLPPTAPRIAYELNLGPIAAFDVTVACCGFLYGLVLADSLVKSTSHSVLLVAANILTRRCRPDDPMTRSLFADGAGAVILSASRDESGILASACNSNGALWSNVLIPDGGSRRPFNELTYGTGNHCMRIEHGSVVFKHAVQSMAEMGNQVARAAGLEIKQVDWWIPHQANMRIIEATGRVLGISPDKTLTTLQDFGNSSAATIPITLDRFLHSDHGPRIREGDKVLFTAAAAGMTSAAVLTRF